MKKRLFLLATLALSSVALASCGDETNNQGGLAESYERGSVDDPCFNRFNTDLAPCTIRVLENDTAKLTGYLDALLKAFNEKYKDYGIVAVDANIDQYTDLAKNGPYGYGPDVLYQANDAIMQYLDGGHILPLPVEALEEYSKTDENAWKAYDGVYKNKMYTFGIPVNLQTGVMYYREDLLPEDSDKNNDGRPDMLETWNALYDYSIKRHEENKDHLGYMRALYDFYFNSGFLFSYGGYIFGNNNTNPKDIGVDAGNSYLGAKVVRQLASVMDMTCIEDTTTQKAYSKLASGEWFCTMTTPDVQNLFIKEMALEYQRLDSSLSDDAATKKAEENLKMISVPKLPVSGDLTDDSQGFFDMTTMGGINGYAISSYTKNTRASWEFVKFATSKEMVALREQYLGIVTCRSDLNLTKEGLNRDLYQALVDGRISLMPSISAVSSIWSPGETFFKTLATDVFLEPAKQKYTTDEALKAGLKSFHDQLYDAIFTLQ